MLFRASKLDVRLRDDTRSSGLRFMVDDHTLSSFRSSDQILPPMLPPRVRDDVEPDPFDNRPEPIFFCV